MTDRSEFESSHVYSSGPRAAAKRDLDRRIMNGDYGEGRFVRLDRAGYLSDLIRYASNGRIEVKEHARGLQFFIVRGGAEGFLWDDLAGIDASAYRVGGGSTTSGATSSTVFDLTDLLIVFDARAKLIGAAPLARPTSISTPKNPLFWTKATAEKVYAAWDNRPVSIYYNDHFRVKYYGLMVDDSGGFYSSGAVRIDIHKQEQTNGCIFILDPDTPRLAKGSEDVLSAWEPQLIKDIQKAVGARVRWNIGTMRMIAVA